MSVLCGLMVCVCVLWRTGEQGDFVNIKLKSNLIQQ